MKMQNYNSKFKNIILGLIISFVLFPTACFGAVLYLEPVEGNYYQGDTFIVESRIDTEDECINVVEANLSFSQDVLEVVDFSRGNSILTFWLKSPTIEQKSGLVSFIGGIPGGYCGILLGDLGENNLLGKIIFKVKEVSGGLTSAKLEFLDSSQVLLNDGFGTPAKLTAKGAAFTILPEKLETPRDEWQEAIEKDNIPPEPFEAKISQNSTIFEGKYFIVFSTIDKQTGIDHYEIKEGGNAYKAGESPYLLEDQKLKSKILVKAVDKAGNERMAEAVSSGKPFSRRIIPAAVALIFLIILSWLIYKLTKKLKIL